MIVLLNHVTLISLEEDAEQLSLEGYHAKNIIWHYCIYIPSQIVLNLHIGQAVALYTEL